MRGKKVKIRMRGSAYDGMVGICLRTTNTKHGPVHRVSFGKMVASFHDSVVVEYKERRKGR